MFENLTNKIESIFSKLKIKFFLKNFEKIKKSKKNQLNWVVDPGVEHDPRRFFDAF